MPIDIVADLKWRGLIHQTTDETQLAKWLNEGVRTLYAGFDPSHLHWQGVCPVEFIRAFPDRIYHVHIKDAITTLNGRSGLLARQ